MGRLAIFFIMLIFASALTGNLMLMLSIEEGSVYIESYSLRHIFNANFSSPAEDTVPEETRCGTGRALKHSHIQLERYAIPEKRVHSLAALEAATPPFLPSPHDFSGFPETRSLPKQHFRTCRTGSLIIPSLQSPVLLI